MTVNFTEYHLTEIHYILNRDHLLVYKYSFPKTADVR